MGNEMVMWGGWGEEGEDGGMGEGEDGGMGDGGMMGVGDEYLSAGVVARLPLNCQ
jgi:hypothetical protein